LILIVLIVFHQFLLPQHRFRAYDITHTGSIWQTRHAVREQSYNLGIYYY